MTTIKTWVKENLGDYLEDIRDHGCSGGFPHISYYTDTAKLYAEFKDEIWEMIMEAAENIGEQPLTMIAGLGGAKDIGCVEQFENLLVWFAVEEAAYQLLAAAENTDEEESPHVDMEEENG
jgi:hypothetical protein